MATPAVWGPSIEESVIGKNFFAVFCFNLKTYLNFVFYILFSCVFHLLNNVFSYH